MGARMKLPGWETRLDSLIASRRETPFRWGCSHCLTFACEAIEARQYIRDSRSSPDRYHGQEFLAFARRLAAQCGYALVLPLFAQRGDIVLVENSDGSCSFAVCIGAKVLGQSAVGLVSLPVSRTRLAWRL